MLLHTYRCRLCKTLATSTATYNTGRPLFCVLCACQMYRLASDLITTPEQQALAARGLVWNPGTSPAPATKEQNP